jgi:hypothetical protein
MFSKLRSIFRSNKLKLYPEDIRETLGYHKRVQRTDPMNHRYTESYVVRHIVNLAYERSGYLKIKHMEISRATSSTLSICDIKRKGEPAKTGR